jgi:hypothetical protein
MTAKTDNAALANAANDSGAFKPLKVVAGKPAKAKRAKAKKPAKGKAKAKAAKPAKVSKPRAESKQARFIAAMHTANGMSIGEAVKAFDWQAHTVRGAIAGAIKKRLGLKVEAEQDEKRGTVYRIKK